MAKRKKKKQRNAGSKKQPTRPSAPQLPTTPPPVTVVVAAREPAHLSTILLSLVTAVIVLAIVTPVVLVILTSFLNLTWLTTSASPHADTVSFDAFPRVWHTFAPNLLFSLQLACLSVIVCLFVGVPAGYALAARPSRGTRVVEEILFLPLSLPGIALSLALLAAYPRLLGSWYLIFLGHLLYTLPFMIRTTIAALRVSSLGTIEAAARSLGAGFIRRLRWVILPNLRRALVAGSLLVFAVSFGEFNISYLLNAGPHQTYPAALLPTLAAGPSPFASAAATLFLAVVLPLLLVIQGSSTSSYATMEQGA